MRAIIKADTIAMGLVLWALFLVVALQFFTRYVLNSSLGWTEEIARMLLIILTYVGAVVCARNQSHIRVDLVVSMFPMRIQVWWNGAIDILSGGLFAFLSWTAIQFAMTTRLEMSTIELSKSIIFWICAVSLGLMALHYARNLYSGRAPLSRTGPSPEG